VNNNWRSEGERTITGSGTTTFTRLANGTYKVEEIDIPDGYTLDTDNEIEVTISRGETEEVEFTNILEETTVIVEEPTPETPPITPEPVPEVVVIPEEVPQAPPVVKTLPKTGVVNPLVMNGLGLLFLSLGFYLKKEE